MARNKKNEDKSKADGKKNAPKPVKTWQPKAGRNSKGGGAGRGKNKPDSRSIFAVDPTTQSPRRNPSSTPRPTFTPQAPRLSPDEIAAKKAAEIAAKVAFRTQQAGLALRMEQVTTLTGNARRAATKLLEAFPIVMPTPEQTRTMAAEKVATQLLGKGTLTPAAMKLGFSRARDALRAAYDALTAMEV